MGPRSLFSHIVRLEKLLIKSMLITLRVQHSFHIGISLGFSSALMIQRICEYVSDTSLVALPVYLGGKTNSPS